MAFFRYGKFISLLAIAVLYSSAAVAAEDGNAHNGADIFTEQCSICHSVKAGKNKIGPSLAGVVGRKAGSIANFAYSDAMKNSGLEWTKENLTIYLKKPNAMIAGIKMPYDGLADEKARLDLIAFLSTQAGQ